MKDVRTKIFASLLSCAVVFPAARSVFADDTAAQRKEDQKVMEKTNDDVKAAARNLEKQGKEQRKAGQNVKKRGEKEAKAVKSDQEKISDLNDRAARLRSQANDEDARGRHDKAAKLRSEANDAENKSRSMTNDLQGKEQAAREREQRGKAIEQKGNQTIQQGQAEQRRVQ